MHGGWYWCKVASILRARGTPLPANDFVKEGGGSVGHGAPTPTPTQDRPMIDAHLKCPKRATNAEGDLNRH
jgi:hypothetical protein